MVGPEHRDISELRLKPLVKIIIIEIYQFDRLLISFAYAACFGEILKQIL